MAARPLHWDSGGVPFLHGWGPIPYAFHCRPNLPQSSLLQASTGVGCCVMISREPWDQNAKMHEYRQ